MELKDIVRKATNEDIKHYEQNKAMEPKIIEDTKRLSKKII
ncbi:MAG: PSP1 domain-containing protein [Clostridium sp.]|nr:MAG: PSP1 domain-containing protein [Clostridium sp.]